MDTADDRGLGEPFEDRAGAGSAQVDGALVLVGRELDRRQVPAAVRGPRMARERVGVDRLLVALGEVEPDGSHRRGSPCMCCLRRAGPWRTPGRVPKQLEAARCRSGSRRGSTLLPGAAAGPDRVSSSCLPAVPVMVSMWVRRSAWSCWAVWREFTLLIRPTAAPRRPANTGRSSFPPVPGRAASAPPLSSVRWQGYCQP
jgi:hypothetical protein